MSSSIYIFGSFKNQIIVNKNVAGGGGIGHYKGEMGDWIWRHILRPEADFLASGQKCLLSGIIIIVNGHFIQ